MSASSKYPSGWMLQGAGEKVFTLAKERVYRLVPDDRKSATNHEGKKSKRLVQVLEDKPKEELLHQVLTEVENRWKAKVQKAQDDGCSRNISSSGNVLLMVKDERALR